MEKILVTGSEGLVGKYLCALMKKRGIEVVEFDINAIGVKFGDVRDSSHIRQAITGVTGIIHLAAVSRVVWGEQDPENCWNTNVVGCRNILEAAESCDTKPWILFSSSREVYGNVKIPAIESLPYNPKSVYGKTKVEGEKLFLNARKIGLTTGIVRLSNVYGSAADHSDRVIPAFVKAAICNQPICIDSPESKYDFTHVSDAAMGIYLYAMLLAKGMHLAPIHLLTGKSTSLEDLATQVINLLDSRSKKVKGVARTYGAGVFSGSNFNAKHILGWQPKIILDVGILELAEQLRLNKTSFCDDSMSEYNRAIYDMAE